MKVKKSWKMKKDFEENRKEQRQEENEENNQRRKGGRKRRRAEGKKKRIAERQKRMKVRFWNIAGLKGKNKGFWKIVEKWDIIMLLETWVEEKEWSKIKRIMPERYVWKCQPATREKKRERARGGIITGVRKGLEAEGRIEREEEGVVERIVKTKEGEWKIIGVYVNNDIDKKIEVIKEYTNEGGIGERIIIGGDFNARTGEKGGITDIFGEERRSRDKEINTEGRKLIKFMEEEGLGILNGTKGDKEGDFTFTGKKGETVIDYIIGNQELWEKTEKVKIGEEIESDHQYVVLSVTEEIEERKREERKVKKVMDWSKEAVEKYRRKIEEKTIDGANPEKLMKEIKNAVARAASWKEIRIDNKAKRKNKWWDGQCAELRREAKKKLRKWKNGEEEKAEYIKKRKEYREKIKERKEKERERIIKEAKEAKNEKEVWKFINRERKHRKEVNEEISEGQWNAHFKRLLGGVGTKQEIEKEKQEMEEGSEDHEGIRREEIEEVIAEMKNRKAAETDGIPNEVWTNGGNALKEAIWKICDIAWRKGEMIEDWNEGIIVPIVKKGEGKEAGDYRGVTLMNTSYKIYAAILAKRLEKEVEEKKLIPETQTGFRKGKGTIENIYALNYVIGRAINKEKGKLVATFIDLKAAFDSVDREILWKVMEKYGISERLRVRIRELYKETRNVIRCNGEKGPCFWTVKGVRQGCPLSALLFVLMLADMEEVMRKGQEGGVVIGNTKIWTLAYADDVVAIAEEEEEMKQMIRRLEKYFDKRKLTVNVGKTKVMRFRKGGGRIKKVDWKWKGERIEEVKEFCYLGYIFQQNGGQEAHIKERVRKATVAMRQVWGIGKRIFGGDWRRRMKLFDSLVASVAMYGAEVWGWKEKESIERIQEKFIRWTLALDWCTPGYMIREETKRVKMRTKAAKRAMRYEEKLENGGGNEIARACWKEIKKDVRKEKSKWEIERRKFYECRGYAAEEIERKREEGWSSIEEVGCRDRDIQIQEIDEKIRESKYNRWYKEIAEIGRPEYLERRGKEKSITRIARFRLGNEMRSGRYWESEEKRRCRVCEAEEETWEHTLERCAREGSDDMGEGIGERVRRILKGNGEGESWMMKLEERREKRNIETETVEA